MSDTINKLKEAEFFLEKLKENKEFFPDCNYYLNAFASSSRSVLWIMKSEYGKNQKFNEWYDKKSANEYEKFLLKGITDMRNRSLKQKPLKIEQYPIVSLGEKSVDIIEEIRRFVEKNGKNKRYNVNISQNDSNIQYENLAMTENSLFVHGTLNIYNTVHEFKNSDILVKCQEYLYFLKDFVEEWIRIKDM